jgi:hypothetical protein
MARTAFERMALRQLVGDRDREGICAEAQAVVGEQTRWVCDSFAMAWLVYCWVVLHCWIVSGSLSMTVMMMENGDNEEEDWILLRRVFAIDVPVVHSYW